MTVEPSVDLRSDTVSRPTAAMRDAMAKADVGDDVLGDDPTVRRLEERAADLLGKDAALFVASGTMANQVAAMTYCARGSEVIVAAASHMFNLEVGALSALVGVQARPICMTRGQADLMELDAAFKRSTLQVAGTAMLCLENTADLNRGWVVSPEDLAGMAEVARAHSVPVYLDGARIFNAAVALNVEVSRLVASADAVMFCLTKGLACPIGSLLVGQREFIAEARRNRQRLGGGWRQAGIIAAAGLVAFDHMIDRLASDHERARRLAQAFMNLGLGTDPATVESNIVRVELPDHLSATAFADQMLHGGVLVKVIAPHAVRLVTHIDIDDEGISRAVDTAARAVTFGTSTQV